MSESSLDAVLIAIGRHEPIRASAILAAGFDVNGFGRRVGRTLLMAAASAARSDLIRDLVSRGAQIDLGSAFEGSALHVAAANGHLGAVTTLLDVGADMEAETESGTTPLMAAAAWGNVDVVELLISRGANVHHHDHAGRTARAIAEEKEEVQIAGLLQAAETLD